MIHPKPAKVFLILISLTLFLFSFSLQAAYNPVGPISVTFSPQSELQGYLSELTSIIDGSRSTLEIALYGFDDLQLYNALNRAAARGVRIRMLYEGAATDRQENSGTLSHQLEAIGIDVRYVNKTLHHKFLIADHSFLVTSSGNWNCDANSVYDENTLWIQDAELVLRYRAEFELLWQNSREFGMAFAFSANNPSSESLLSQIVDQPGRDACFTSANYRTYISGTYGPTFAKISGNQVVADRLVELINQSTQSIRMAANHLRSRPIAEALIAKKRQYPGMEIQVYLDGQEYISEEYNQIQIAEREQELASATTPGEIRDILEKDFYYSYELIQAGIDVRFKTYSYKWRPETSAMMHHKYAIFDQRIVATGSYNYSYNSETENMENLLVFDNAFASQTVAAFEANFESIWQTGRAEGFYNDLIQYINSGSRYIPVLYPAMALTYGEIRSLREITERVCPAVNGPYFKDNSQFFAAFPKGLQFTYDQNQRVVSLQDGEEQKYGANYTHNDQNLITGIYFQSVDNLRFSENYIYTETGNLIGLGAPGVNLNFTYDTNNQLTSMNTGQGTYTWSMENNGSGSLTRYSTPIYANYLTVQSDRYGMPVVSTDADGRSLDWRYDDDTYLSSIVSPNRTINYQLNDQNRDWLISTTDNESIRVQKPGWNELNMTTTGTVAANLTYRLMENQDKTTKLAVDIISNHVASGAGKKASVEYLLDAYGRVTRAGNLQINRKSYSGKILSIICNNMIETRNYDAWEQLINQQVSYKGQIYFRADYHYDGFQRIDSVTENILGAITTYQYAYDQSGRLATVSQNGSLVEQYAYDPFGNRTGNTSPATTENYINNGANRLTEMWWQLPDRIRKTEYSYNNSGQLLHAAYKTEKDGSQWLTKERYYDYDVFGNLQRVAWASQRQEYKYDPFNRVIAKIQNGLLAAGYIYGLGDAPLAELNENGRIINVYLYGDGDVPVAMQKAGADYYIISDIRGSTRMVVKSDTGEIRRQIAYDSFGKVLEDSNPGYTPFGFAGGLYDYRTELVRFGARDYHPETGRWTSEDPIGFLGGDFNFFTYVGNDPVNFVDPSGLSGIGVNSKAFVIGEGMDYVKAAAKELRQRGIPAKWYQAWGKNFPKDEFGRPIPMTPEQLKATQKRNARIIRQKINQGYAFYDIGPDGRLESPFYRDTEKRILNESDFPVRPYPRPKL
ncbi:MAG TPA: phospholipase D-like domain-containing protein [Bacillota bacterium]|nr:phospholipase D-like domain-containing protein [Bacillota bacterium]